MTEAMQIPTPRGAGESARDWRFTVDRLVVEISAAVADSASGVPESQRLIAYLSGEVLPGLHQVPGKTEQIVELSHVVDSMQGTNGTVACDLAWQARAIVMSAT